jgi:hypothetical protein
MPASNGVSALASVEATGCHIRGSIFTYLYIPAPYSSHKNPALSRERGPEPWLREIEYTCFSEFRSVRSPGDAILECAVGAERGRGKGWILEERYLGALGSALTHPEPLTSLHSSPTTTNMLFSTLSVLSIVATALAAPSRRFAPPSGFNM